MKHAFVPTHMVPAGGLPTWPQPDRSQPNGPSLPAYLPVVAREQRAEWTLVECSNGWQAWIDRELVVLDDSEPALQRRGPVRLGKVVVSVPLLGGLVIMLSSVLPWMSSDALQIPKLSAFKFPFGMLTDDGAFDASSGTPLVLKPGGTSIGTVVLLLGLAVVVLSQTKAPSIVGRICGWMVLVIATGFVARVQGASGELIVARSFSFLAVGVYVSALSGLVVGLARGPAQPAAAAQGRPPTSLPPPTASAVATPDHTSTGGLV